MVVIASVLVIANITLLNPAKIPKNYTDQVFFYPEPNDSLYKQIKELHKLNVLDAIMPPYIYGSLRGLHPLPPGQYLLPRGLSAYKAIEKIANATPTVRNFLVMPGETVLEMVDSLIGDKFFLIAKH